MLYISLIFNATTICLILLQWQKIRELKEYLTLSNYYKDLYNNLWRSVTGRPGIESKGQWMTKEESDKLRDRNNWKEI